MAITKHPPIHAAAFNPVYVETDSSTLSITCEGRTVSMYRELVDGKATFDIHQILLGFLDFGVTPGSEENEDFRLIEGPREIYYSLNGSGGYFAVAAALPWNAASADLNAYRSNPVLSLRPRSVFPQYVAGQVLVSLQVKGYPMTVNSQDEAIELDEDTWSVVDFVNKQNPRGQIEMIITGDFDPVRFTVTEPECYDENAILVEWVNNLGGIEYYLFDGHKTWGQETKRGDAVDAYHVFGTAPSMLELAPTVTDRLVLGKEMLDRGWYDFLKTLAPSPEIHIRRNLGARGSWSDRIPVRVADTAFSWNTGTAKGSVAFEFTLPPNDTQF